MSGVSSVKRTLQAGLVLCAAVAASGAADAAEGVEAITRPSVSRTLSFVRPGRVAEVLVEEGDRIEPGTVLIRLDDRVARAQHAQLKAQAEDDVRVRAAKAQFDQKKVNLEMVKDAFANGAATKLEVDNAVLDVKIAELSLELAKFERSQAKRKLAESELQLENMRLVSKTDGTVRRVLVEENESADALEDVLEIVKIDPLHVEAYAPLTLARGLSVGQAASVLFEGESVPGKVTFVDEQADPASRTVRVRVEAPNASRRPAGEAVRVIFGSAEGGDDG